MRFTNLFWGFLILLSAPGTSQALDFLIWDLDLNMNSGPALNSTLVAGGYTGQYTTNISPYLGSLPNYQAIFICLGVWPNDQWLGSYPEAVDSLVSYLINYDETNIYMEGGETWYTDPPTDLHPYFQIQGLAHGLGDTDTILGQTGTFTQGMSFDYGGDNAWMNRIAPSGTAFTVFANQNPVYVNGVAYRADPLYRTIGTSFEFGGLSDGTPPSTKLDLAHSIMDFFRIWHYNDDVGVLSMDSPPKELCANEPISPQATLKNWGRNTAVNFQVTCDIDSGITNIYSDTRTVSSLSPGAILGVSFNTWTPDGHGNCYQVTVYTTYSPDLNFANDSAYTTACVFALGDSLDSATFPALGPQTLAGITYCSRDSRFYFVSRNDKYVYRLNPYDWALERAFATNIPGTEIPWGISWDGQYFWISTIGPNYSYDRQYSYSGNPNSYYVDMGAATGCNWAAGVDYDRKFTRQVSYGGTGAIYRLDLLEPLDPVLDSIKGPWSSGTERACCYIPYTHEILTGGINSGILYKVNADDGTVVEQASLPLMADLDLFDLGVIGLDTLHALVTLEDAQNTILKIALALRRPLADFAPVAIDSPQGDTVYDSLQVRATVANWGKQAQTGVWVSCSVTPLDSLEPEWADSLRVSLGPGREGSASFGFWMPSQKAVYYEIRVKTHLLGDEIPYNDDIAKTVYSLISIRDSGVLFIFTPPDTVYSDSTYIPIVAVKNFGDYTETFDVTCTIDSYRDTVRVIGLAPGASTPVTFDPWQVPSPDSTQYTMTVATHLLGDRNPRNDTLFKPIFAWRAAHDGGVDSILSPPDSVSLGGVYPVSALIHNYGTVREDSFRVKCSMNGQEDSLWVRNLSSGSTVQVVFPDSFQAVGPAPWMVTVYTLVSGDNNPTNDTLTKTVYLTGVEELTGYQFPVASFQLWQNSPNPFTHSTTIRYSLPSADGGQRTAVSLAVYDLSGRLVRTLVDEAQSPGYYSVSWDGKDSSGRRAWPGAYFCRITVGDPALPPWSEASKVQGSGAEVPALRQVFTATRKMLVLR